MISPYMMSLRQRLASMRDNSIPRFVRVVLALVVIMLVAIWVIIATRPEPLPNMTIYDNVGERKAAFFDYLGPIVEEQNREILDDREWLLEIADAIASGAELGLIQRRKLRSLAEHYRVDWDESNLRAIVEKLGRRVDAVPVPLVLVQAAKESGWGRSRFAREANNLFGQWCYRAGCGLVPSKRASGARHEVRKFDSVGDSVAAYLHNINTGKVYRKLREIRQRLRNAGKRVNGALLADGLLFYSQRREAYVNEVKLMLRQYHRSRASGEK